MAPTPQPLFDFWIELQDPRVLWQAALFSAALLVGWFASRLFARRLARTADNAHPRLGLQAARALSFPLVALVIVLVGRSALSHFQGTAITSVAIAVLTTLAILQFGLLLVRHVFAPGSAQLAITRAIAWAVWAGLALHLTGVAPELLGVLENAHIKIGRQSLSVLLILQALLALFTAVLIALWLGRYAETRLMAAESVQMSLRVMLTKLAKAVFVLLAVLIALPAVGIDITALSVFGGMLGVGIGFGLQKIAANYVSGFIILMDRSVSIGDVLTVDKYNGRVTRMTARYIVLRNPAGTEALIPNETLVGSAVINHTYSDRRVHVPITVQVAYGTDLERAVTLLMDCARAHPRALQDPAPKVLIKELGDNGIHLELGVWIDDPEDGIVNIRSDMYFELLTRLAEAGIEIPYPQRELRMRATTPEEQRNTV